MPTQAVYRSRYGSKIEYLYNFYNKESFEGKLPSIEKLNFFFSKDSSIYGYCKPLKSGKFRIALNIMACRLSAGTGIEGTLLHEMVHAWQYFVLKMDWDSIGHGDEFVAKAKELEDKYNLEVI